MKYILVILLFLSVKSFAQDFHLKFTNAEKEKDLSAQKRILTNWEEKEPNNSALYSTYFRWFYSRAREVVDVDSLQSFSTKSMIIADTITNKFDKREKYIFFNKPLLKEFLKKVDKGIQHFPNRLDMRKQELTTLRILRKWEDYANGVVALVEHSKKIDNRWLCPNNCRIYKSEKEEKRKDSFLFLITMTQTSLFHNDQFDKMQKVAESLLKNYSNSNSLYIYGYPISCLMKEKYERAITFLLKAKEQTDQPLTAIHYLAMVYKAKGDIEKAINHFEIISEKGDGRNAEIAKRQIEELKKHH